MPLYWGHVNLGRLWYIVLGPCESRQTLVHRDEREFQDFCDVKSALDVQTHLPLFLFRLIFKG